MATKGKPITRQDVEQALARFRRQGRHIAPLESQPTPTRPGVSDAGGGSVNLLDLALNDPFRFSALRTSRP